MHWFDYSIIRYCPNSIRGETVNIGLVVFRPSGIDLKLINNSMKMKIIDNSSELEDISKFASSIVKLCEYAETPNDQYLLIKAFSSAIRISERNAFSISELSQYNKKIESLYVELIKPYSFRQTQVSTSRLQTKIRQDFTELKILAKDKSEIYQHKIVPNFEISEKSGMTADFMLKNGRFHMTEVIDFNVNDVNLKMKETTLKIMTFMEGKKHISDDIGCYLVYAADKDKLSEVIQHLSLAEDYSDKMFNFNSMQEKASYYQLMKNLVGSGLQLN